MLQTQTNAQAQQQWPSPSPDTQKIETEPARPLHAESLPSRAIVKQPWYPDLIGETITAVFDELDLLADTLPGRNAIAATFKKLGVSEKQAISDYAYRSSPELTLTREEMLALEDAEARGLASAHDVFTIHYMTGADVSDVLEAITNSCPEGRFRAETMQEIISRYSRDSRGGETDFIRTLQSLTGISPSRLTDIATECFSSMQDTGQASLLGSVTRRIMTTAREEELFELRETTINAITEIVHKDRPDSIVKNEMTELYNEAFRRMYDVRTRDVIVPVAMDALKKAGLFFFDCTVTENLPQKAKEAIYRARGMDDETPKMGRSGGALILEAAVYSSLLIPHMNDGSVSGAVATSLGIIFGSLGVAITTMARMIIATVRDNDSLMECGHPIVELIGWPIIGIYEGIKASAERVIEDKKEQKKRQREAF